MRNCLSREDTLVLKAVVLYILKNSTSSMKHSVYHLVKTAFVAQQKHLAKYLCPMFNDRIVALQFGPVPSDIYNALKIARGDEKARAYNLNDNLYLVYDAISFDQESFGAVEEPDMDYLSESAVVCLNEALREVSKMSFEKILKVTHKGEWLRAYENPGDKTMNSLAIAEEGGADEAALAYLKESMDVDAMLK